MNWAFKWEVSLLLVFQLNVFKPGTRSTLVGLTSLSNVWVYAEQGLMCSNELLHIDTCALLISVCRPACQIWFVNDTCTLLNSLRWHFCQIWFVNDTCPLLISLCQHACQIWFVNDTCALLISLCWHACQIPLKGGRGCLMSSPLSGISGLSFDSTLLSPLLFFCLVLLLFLSYLFFYACWSILNFFQIIFSIFFVKR